MSDFELNQDDEIAQVSMAKPHVVILGAGASRAACPTGDRNGRKLPLMSDLTEVLGLQEIVGRNSNGNFEDFYSSLRAAGDNAQAEEVEHRVQDYFGQLRLPDEPNLYDYLVLSLRDKDVIATFNWDPLLVQACRRMRHLGVRVPRLAFLHGNVGIGYCETDHVLTPAKVRCNHCGQPVASSRLLYPIGKKDYASDSLIADQWNLLKWGLKNAFMVTIFGYSGPRSDQEAIGAMKTAWGTTSDRQFEQTEFITTATEAEVLKNWSAFIFSHHYEVHDSYFDSWLAQHPRRSGEAWWNQNIEAKFIDANPAPRGGTLEDLWRWFERFRPAESADEKRTR